MKKLALAALCVSLAMGAAAQALDDATLSGMAGRIVIVRTSGGGNFQGTLLAVREDRIELIDGEGQILALARDALASVEPREAGRDPAEYFQDSAANRLIVMPTGFGMEKGELHIAAQEIVIITASYGISSNFSVWGGISIPGALVNLRYSTPAGSGAALSFGSFLGASWFAASGVALPYALASFGHPNRNLTFAAGVPLWWSPEGGVRPAGVVGAIGDKIIVSSTASIVTENWVVAVSDGWAWTRLELMLFPAVVFRIAGSRLSWDIGAIVPLALHNMAQYSSMGEILGYGGIGLEGLMGGTVIPLPILSVTYRID